jgi:hypothetical protein
MTVVSAANVRSKRVLAPQERVAEVLFGLIMVLTFTGSLSVAEAGRNDVRSMLIGAFGCNLAWGVIDGVFYLMGALGERGRNLVLFRALQSARDKQDAARLITEALPPLVASLLRPDELHALHERLLALPEPATFARPTSRDLLGALAVFLLVFLSTFPVALPFVLMHETARAMRWSNGIALAILLVAGAAYGRAVGRSATVFALAMAAIGAALVALTIALGG